MEKTKNWILLFMLLAIASSCANVQSVSETSYLTRTGVPLVPREFRAAWVATVANINWPSEPGLSTKKQQEEAVFLLDFLARHHFNAVIFQVRPQADALYESKLEPWSYYLSGEQGRAPDPYYDPLAFWVEEAHKRGLELHVWLNPYRAHHKDGGEVTKYSIVKRMPESVMKLKEGYWWFDPALPATQDHSAAVVMDIVRRYDIDGVHFDDYFYPYESYNEGADFPDDASWAAYQQQGGKRSRADWRRSHVNTFIQRIYKEIKAERKEVKFGLSPFGIWRPGYPESIQGMDQYNSLYADAKLWLNEGWVDYFTPQLYWPIAQIPQSFPVLLGWWQQENTKGRHLWPGMNVGRGGDTANLTEVSNQIMITRAMLPVSSGAVHWSIAGLTRHELLANGLLDGPYKRSALVPQSPWLGMSSPSQPRVKYNSPQGGQIDFSWNHPQPEEVFRWVVYYRYGDAWQHEILNQHDTEFKLPLQNNKDAALAAVFVTAINRLGNESKHPRSQHEGLWNKQNHQTR